MPGFGSLYPSDIGALMPEASVQPGDMPPDPLVRLGKKALYDVPKGLVDTARATPYGLRREDFTDIPGSQQPIDPLVGQATNVATGALGAPQVGAVEGGGLTAAQQLRRFALRKGARGALGGAPDVAGAGADIDPTMQPMSAPLFGSLAPGKRDEDAVLQQMGPEGPAAPPATPAPSMLHRIHNALSITPSGAAGFAAGAVPGAGIADALGYMPDMQGGTNPSFGQNVRAGRYGQAGLQTLGLAGDLMLATPAAPLGELAKEAAVAGRRAAPEAEAGINWARGRTGLGGAGLRPGDVVTDVPVRALDRAHQATDPDMYIAKPKQSVMDHMASGNPISLPEVYIGKSEYPIGYKEIVFGNGRNRVAAARDLGAKTIPVATSADQVDALHDLLAYHSPEDYPERAPPIGHNQPPPESEMSAHEIAYPPTETPPVDRSKFVDASGQPIKGAAYTKEARKILDEIDAGPKGAGPIDLTRPGRMPDVPQTFLPRYDPPGGISARLQDAFNNPDVLNGLREGIRKGVEMGADKWYDTGAIRAAFIDELGPTQGDAEFKRYMQNVAATSPRSDVPTNVRNASYYYSHATPADLPEKLPYPYGHVAQNLHRQNFETITSPEGWDVMKNPKPASFVENLIGNHEPVTADTHAFRAIGMRTKDPRFLEPTVSAKYKMGTDPTKDTIVNKYGERNGDTVTFRPQQLFNSGKLTMDDALKIPYFWAAKPNANEYGAVEDLYRYLGDEHGLTPAGAQAAGWAGSGELTGLGTVPNKTFPELMNERILFTAKMRGEDPKLTLKNFIRGKKPLLSTALGAGVAGAAAASGLGTDKDKNPQFDSWQDALAGKRNDGT